MLLILSINHGLKGERNSKLKAVFWLLFVPFVYALVHIRTYKLNDIALPTNFLSFVLIITFLTQLVLVGMCAFGRNKNSQAKKTFILLVIYAVIWIIGIAFS
jgi:hypothetical protein